MLVFSELFLTIMVSEVIYQTLLRVFHPITNTSKLAVWFCLIFSKHFSVFGNRMKHSPLQVFDILQEEQQTNNVKDTSMKPTNREKNIVNNY